MSPSQSFTNLTQQQLNLFLRAGLAVRLGTGLLSGLLEVSVDTIWQCTVPNNSMRHNGPTTSLAQAAGTSKYNTAPATAKNTNSSDHDIILRIVEFISNRKPHV